MSWTSTPATNEHSGGRRPPGPCAPAHLRLPIQIGQVARAWCEALLSVEILRRAAGRGGHLGTHRRPRAAKRAQAQTPPSSTGAQSRCSRSPRGEGGHQTACRHVAHATAPAAAPAADTAMHSPITARRTSCPFAFRSRMKMMDESFPFRTSSSRLARACVHTGDGVSSGHRRESGRRGRGGGDLQERLPRQVLAGARQRLRGLYARPPGNEPQRAEIAWGVCGASGEGRRRGAGGTARCHTLSLARWRSRSAALRSSNSAHARTHATTAATQQPHRRSRRTRTCSANSLACSVVSQLHQLPREVLVLQVEEVCRHGGEVARARQAAAGRPRPRARAPCSEICASR